MFRKLVSNLPFNPSLLGTLSFYAKRAKEEETLRRLGFGFVALAMFVQMFAVIAPPEKSLAYSSDYIINGLRTRDDILRAWDGHTSDRDVAAIYGRFGITREDIAALPMQPNVTIKSNWADYWTMGRTSLSAVSKASKIKRQYKNSEIPVNYGRGTVYVRQLRAWDIVNPVNSYRAFEGVKDGKKFWILVDCGNLTTDGPPNLKQPELEFRKTIDGGPRTLKPGDEFTFRFQYRNKIRDSLPAQNVVLHDEFDLDKFSIVSSSPRINLIGNGKQIALPLNDVAYSSTFKTALAVKVRLKSSLANGTKACNAAKLTAENAKEAWSGGSNLCITVNKPVEPPTTPPKPEPKKCPLDSTINETDSRCEIPVVACVLTNPSINRTTKSFTLKTTASSSNKYLTTITGYEYDFGDGSKVVSRRSASYSDNFAHTYEDGSFSANVAVNYRIGKGSAQKDASSNCSAQIESDPDQPLTQEKEARNISQDLSPEKTLETKAAAKDVIEYSLITRNTYDYDRANVNVSDYIGDILDYADLDNAFLKSQGGSFDESTKTLSWTGQTVKANSEKVNKFRVKLKEKIPSTNQPSTLTTSYDCKISNKFGNQLDIEVDCPLPKSAEYVTERLPNTGPGTSLVIGFTATAIVAYFFARSRLINKELEIIRTDFAQAGGL